MAYGVFGTTSSGWNVHYIVSLASTTSASPGGIVCRLQFKSRSSLVGSGGSGGSGRPVEGKMFPRK